MHWYLVHIGLPNGKMVYNEEVYSLQTGKGGRIVFIPIGQIINT